MKKRDLCRLNNDFVQVFCAVFAFMLILVFVFYETALIGDIFSINLKMFLKTAVKHKEYFGLILYILKVLSSISIVYFLFCLYSFMDGIIGYNCREILTENKKGTVLRFIIKSFEWKIYRLWIIFSGSIHLLFFIVISGLLLFAFFPQFLVLIGLNIGFSCFLLSTLAFFIISMIIASAFSSIRNCFESDLGFECLCMEPYSKFVKIKNQSVKVMQPYSFNSTGFFVGLAYFLFLIFEIYQLYKYGMKINREAFFIFASANVIIFAVYKIIRFLLCVDAFDYPAEILSQETFEL